MSESDVIVHGQEAFQHIDSIADRFTRMLAHEGLIDLLASYRLLPGDSPLHLDMLTYTHCLAAIYSDRARIAAIASGSSTSIDPDELRARVTAAAATTGAIKRTSDALAHCEALPDGPVRELERLGLAISSQVIAARASGGPPVDFFVHARLLEAAFRKTHFVRHVAEGKEPSPLPEGEGPSPFIGSRRAEVRSGRARAKAAEQECVARRPRPAVDRSPAAPDRMSERQHAAGQVVWTTHVPAVRTAFAAAREESWQDRDRRSQRRRCRARPAKLPRRSR